MNDEKYENYKYDTFEEPFQTTGNELKPKNEVEVTDLSNKDEVDSMIHYLSNLEKDPDYNKLSSLKNKRMSKEEFQQMMQQDPGGTYVIKDGKRISMAQFMKNKKSQNTKANYGYQPSKKDSPYDTVAAGKSNPSDYQSMVNNQKKVK